MDIRKRLTYQFVIIVALIFLLASVAIYFFSADYRENVFYERLKSKATNIAQLLIQVDEIDANLLRRIEQDNPLSLPEEKIIIYNYKNDTLYSSDDENILNITVEILNEVRLEEEIHFRKGQHEVLGFLFTDRYDRFVVIAGAIDIYGVQKLKNLRTILFIVFGVSIVVVFLSGRIFADKALKPIARVIDQVNDISVTNLDIRLEERKENDEITLLTHTFNKMLDRLEVAFKLQKNFIANASHELRTPLTAITGQMEVMLLRERTNEEYKQAIASVLDDMKNLNNLSNRLLLLAQASAEYAHLDKKLIRIDDILWESREVFLKLHPECTVNVIFDNAIDDENKLVIQGHEELIKIAITNLLDNSCKYSDDHRAEVMITHASSQLILQFRDKGIGIPKEDLKEIFEPFFRGKNVFNIKGHGIGLSLVQKIINAHNGEIGIASEIDKGTTITITIPSDF